MADDLTDDDLARITGAGYAGVRIARNYALDGICNPS